MTIRYLEISLFLVLTISSAYTQELESLCGKSNMVVTNKSFSFAWTISGYGERMINDTSSFSLATDKIIFNDLGSEFWKFHINKHGYRFIVLSANLMETQQEKGHSSTIYTITPVVSIADQEIRLDTTDTSRIRPMFQWFSNIGQHTDCMPKHSDMSKPLNKWTSQIDNLTKQVQILSGQNRFKRSQSDPQTVVSPLEKGTHHEVSMSMHQGFFPNHNFCKSLTWQNIFPKLSDLFAETGNTKDMKITFLIEATTSTTEFLTVKCS